MHITNSESNTRKFYGNAGKIITGIFVISILTGLLLWLGYDLIRNFVVFVLLIVFDRIKIPVCFITGFFIDFV